MAHCPENGIMGWSPQSVKILGEINEIKNAAPKAALKLSKLGFRVKEMTGGIVWWKERFGYPIEGTDR